MATVTILGAGNMARGIATRLLAGGNDVQILARTAGEASDLAAALDPGSGRVSTGATGDELRGEFVVLAVPYAAAAPLVHQHGQQLADKILVDITNPLNETYSGLVTAPGTSAAEEIAQVAPAGTKLVKAFNTTFAGTLAAGTVAGQPLDVLLAGDDPDAKAGVAQLVKSGGLRAIDAGGLERARLLEALGLLHITLQPTLGTGFGSAVKFLA